ncbi:hypothetical protein AB4Y89_01865 [Terriglobus sp. 2YAB30_2]|uniref:hypothetical protein n=1 Tax=unclassified Terriglobus TaxID=2628988 RepID=UPI003F96E686
MQKPGKVEDKYYLKAVHQEISLYDRKMAHLNRFEIFASDAERETALRKMNGKRELLVKTARRLAGDGIEFKESDLPHSFRTAVIAPELVISAMVDHEQSIPTS